MKLVIASDLHGSATATRELVDRIEEESPDRVALLGDLLYHGPRNNLPEGHAPREVARILNGFAGRIVAVRGNCDAEVDQMVLDFPCMADYAVVMLGGTTVIAAHGHREHPVPAPGDILVTGHTHIRLDEMENGFRHLNPGSVSLPKGGTPRGYIVMGEDGSVRFMDLD